MSTPIVDVAAKVFTEPTAYTDEARLHAALTHLRTHAPVSRVDYPPYRPFWAITKHADVMEIERANDLFINEARTVLAPADAEALTRARLDAGIGLRTLVHMDGFRSPVWAPVCVRTSSCRNAPKIAGFVGAAMFATWALPGAPARYRTAISERSRIWKKLKSRKT
jgi:hypothetical protein